MYKRQRPAPAGTASVETTVVPSEYQRSEIVRVMPSGPATAGASGGFEVQQPRASEIVAEPPPQPARGSASVRFEAAPEPAPAEPAR